METASYDAKVLYNSMKVSNVFELIITSLESKLIVELYKIMVEELTNNFIAL